MRAYTYSIHVDRSPDDVWRFLTDLSQTQWRSMIRSMEVVGGGPVRAGSDIRIAIDAFGAMRESVSHTAVFDPPKRWTLKSGSNRVFGEFDYTVAPDGSGSRVTMTCDLTSRRLLGWIFLPLMARQERRLRKNQPGAFKSACEAAIAR